MVGEPATVVMPSAPANYLERIKTFIRNNRDDVVIQKLRNNQPITAAELGQLETLLFDGGERGTKADFIRATGSEQPLGQFIRSILGLDSSAALAAFSTFLEKGKLSADQQKFLEIIIHHFEVKGILDPKQLYEAQGLDGLFSDVECSNIVSIIRGVNTRAMVG